MSESNETNQTKPDYKIESCVTCPAELVCCSLPDGDSCIICYISRR